MNNPLRLLSAFRLRTRRFAPACSSEQPCRVLFPRFSRIAEFAESIQIAYFAPFIRSVGTTGSTRTTKLPYIFQMPQILTVTRPTSPSRRNRLGLHGRVLVSVFAVCLCVSSAAFAKDLRDNSNINFVRDLYHNVNDTIPSDVNAEENEDTVRKRLTCYEEYHDYALRIQICNNAYVKQIVHLARQAVRSRPSLGEFVLNVGMCPIQYNLCMGQTENNKERCITFERQCIDYTLDVFWRGAAQYTQQTYWLDQ